MLPVTPRILNLLTDHDVHIRFGVQGLHDSRLAPVGVVSVLFRARVLSALQRLALLLLLLQLIKLGQLALPHILGSLAVSVALVPVQALLKA